MQKCINRRIVLFWSWFFAQFCPCLALSKLNHWDRPLYEIWQETSQFVEALLCCGTKSSTHFLWLCVKILYVNMLAARQIHYDMLLTFWCWNIYRINKYTLADYFIKNTCTLTQSWRRHVMHKFAQMQLEFQLMFTSNVNGGKKGWSSWLELWHGGWCQADWFEYFTNWGGGWGGLGSLVSLVSSSSAGGNALLMKGTRLAQGDEEAYGNWN